MLSMSKSWENKKWSAATIFMKLWDNRPPHEKITVVVANYKYNNITENFVLYMNKSIQLYDVGDVELLDLIEKLKPRMIRYGYTGTSRRHDRVFIETVA